MTNQEFDTEFDVLYNNITSNQAPGLNTYEKSVFLTKAQAQLVNEYFNNKADAMWGGFDGSRRRQYDFSNLLKTTELFDVNIFQERVSDEEKLCKWSYVYLFPKDYFLAVTEVFQDAKQQFSVIPLRFTEYQRLMLKPYNFPVKKAVWRLFTNSKNCNYYREEVGDTEYVFLSSFADQDRPMEITIVSNNLPEDFKVPDSVIDVPSITYSDGTHPKVYVADSYLDFYAPIDSEKRWMRIEVDYSWDTKKECYLIKIIVSQEDKYYPLDDGDTIEALKIGFTLLKYAVTTKKVTYDFSTIKVAAFTDGFQMCSAPTYLNSFQEPSGKTFKTEIVQLPLAEVIGAAFQGTLHYKLRYVKTLTPIILEDLNNYSEELSIEGKTKATECVLPTEVHQEILERAVTLAKIAWSGGTAAQTQRSD